MASKEEAWVYWLEVRALAAPVFALHVLASQELLDRAQGQGGGSNFLGGYRLLIGVCLFEYLDNLIRAPEVIGIREDNKLLDWWRFDQGATGTKLEDGGDPKSQLSMAAAKVVSLWVALRRAKEWNEVRQFASTLSSVTDAALGIIRSRCSFAHKSLPLRGDELEGEAMRSLTLPKLWSQLTRPPVVSAALEHVFRQRKTEGVPAELDTDDDSLPETKLERGPRVVAGMNALPEQWFNGYWTALLSLMLTVHPKTAPWTQFVRNIANRRLTSWADLWVLNRTAPPDAPAVVIRRRKGKGSKRALARLLLPVDSAADEARARWLFTDPVVIVGSGTSPSTVLNFEAVIAGLCATVEDQIRVVQIEHPDVEGYTAYSLAVYMRRQGLFSSDSMWWVFLDCYDDSMETQPHRTAVNRVVSTYGKKIDWEKLQIPLDSFRRLCEEPGFTYLRDSVEVARRRFADVRGVLPELLAAALLGAWDCHPIRVSFRAAWLGRKEIDVVGLRWTRDVPTEILIVEAKGRATIDQELQAKLQDFEKRCDLVRQNTAELVRDLLRLQSAEPVPVRGIFVSMADLGRFRFKHSSNIELWDFKKFLSRLRQARIPKLHINLLRQEVLAQEIASLDELFSLI